MKYFYNFLFFLYKTIIQGVFFLMNVKTGKTCRFYPTCSEYSKEVFLKYGFLKGFKKTVQRITKCHPWNKGGVDLP